MSINLHKLGYQVDLVADGSTAIQKIHSKTYDLIIKDINLRGDISGKEVIQEIREIERNVDTPVIVWSAYVHKNDEKKYITWGADGVLIKACRVKELKKSIAQSLLKVKYKERFCFEKNSAK
jgi:DNA-binding response OmpR family regulator